MNFKITNSIMSIGTGTGLFGSTATQPSFGTKPAASTTLNFGAAAAPTFGFASQQSSTLFGQQPAAAKPLFSSSFGNAATAPAAGSLFGQPSTGIGSSLSLNPTGFGGLSNTSFGSQPAAAGASGATQNGQQLPIHQYILTLSEISQSSDHPLFRKMLEPTGTSLSFQNRLNHAKNNRLFRMVLF